MRRTGRIGRGLTASVTLAAVLLGVTATGPAPAGAATAVTGSATTEAVAAVTSSGSRVAVATVHTRDGTTTVAGEADALFPSESVVKVLVAARLLVDGGPTGEAEAMVAASDDGAANRLWGEVGGPDVVAWATERYGVTGLGEPSEWGWWGNTKVSARAVATLYAALLADPVTGPWLTRTMAATTAVAADGTDQTFGFGRWLGEGRTAVKQGWGGDDDTQSTANLLSTGYLDGTHAVAVIVQDPASSDALALVPEIDAVAAAVVDDLTAAAEAAVPDESAASAQEAAARAARAADLPVAAGAADPQTVPWWAAVVVVLLGSAVVGGTTVVLSDATRRRAVPRPW